MTDQEVNANNEVASLRLNDRVVWLSDYGPEYGLVKWIGRLPEADPNAASDLVAGIEFVSNAN